MGLHGGLLLFGRGPAQTGRSGSSSGPQPAWEPPTGPIDDETKCGAFIGAGSGQSGRWLVSRFQRNAAPIRAVRQAPKCQIDIIVAGFVFPIRSSFLQVMELKN